MLSLIPIDVYLLFFIFYFYFYFCFCFCSFGGIMFCTMEELQNKKRDCIYEVHVFYVHGGGKRKRKLIYDKQCVYKLWVVALIERNVWLRNLINFSNFEPIISFTIFLFLVIVIVFSFFKKKKGNIWFYI